MPGNSFGTLFRVTTFGESHGYGVGAVIDGCPPRISLQPEDFYAAMAARRPGKSPSDTPRREKDTVKILSGVFKGLTTGTPITLLILNRDVNSRPYEILSTLFRPGHGDYTYFKKYGHFDYTGGGRASARETAARVAAGVVADKILYPLGIEFTAFTVELGGIRIKKIDLNYINKSPLLCPDPDASEEMIDLISKVRQEGDSLGGIVEARISGCPPGFGEPVFDKLEADLAKAVMSIGAVKGVEIGEGFGAARLRGSENNDSITPDGFASNHAGGILAGISNGETIIIRAAVKPIPTIRLEQDTINREGQPAKLKMQGRYDISAIPRIIPVITAMLKIVLADHYLRQRAIMTGTKPA